MSDEGLGLPMVIFLLIIIVAGILAIAKGMDRSSRERLEQDRKIREFLAARSDAVGREDDPLVVQLEAIRREERNRRITQVQAEHGASVPPDNKSDWT